MTTLECQDRELAGWLQDAIRPGHFLLGDGSHVDRFPFVGPILWEQERCRHAVNLLWSGIRRVVGMDALRRVTVLATAGIPGIIVARTLSEFMREIHQYGRGETDEGLRLAGATWHSPRHLLIDPAARLSEKDGVLICDDIVWSGYTTRQLYNTIRMTGAAVVAGAVILGRQEAIDAWDAERLGPLVCVARSSAMGHEINQCPDVTSLKRLPMQPDVSRQA